jgi:ABC-type phosphate/phosphonate transport system substrate-binding protein
MPTRLTLSYYPWITQSISGPVLARAVGQFRGLLEEELRRRMGNALELNLLPELEIPEQLRDMEEKPAGDLVCKVGLLNPLGYALVHAEVKDVQAIAVVRRKMTTGVGPIYKAQLYTHRKTAIKKVADARGRSMAFGSPQSTSNFLIPAMMLWKAGIHPLNGFSRVDFSGGHDKAAVAVYESRLEVGAGHDGVIIDLANRPGYGDADQVLTNIAWSDDIPSDPVAVRAADPAMGKQVAQALIAVAKPNDGNSEGNQAVKAFWATSEGFETISPDKYDFLHDVMKSLGLRPPDMLRKP